MEELAGWEEPPAGRLEAEFWSSPEEQVVLDREFFLRLHFLQALFFSLRIGGGSGVWFSGEVIVLKCKAKGLSPSTERKKKKGVVFKSVMVVHNHSPSILEIYLEDYPGACSEIPQGAGGQSVNSLNYCLKKFFFLLDIVAHACDATQ